MGDKFSWLITILTAASLLLGIANTIWAWMSKGGAALAAKQREQDSALDDHDKRIQAIEGEMKHLPTKEDVHRLTVQLTELNGKLNSFERDLNGVERTVGRIERHLLGESA